MSASAADEAGLHRRLAHFNQRRLRPGLVEPGWPAQLAQEYEMCVTEGCFVEDERRAATEAIGELPRGVDAFMQWFEGLQRSGPGQGDALFPWLERTALREEMRWFLAQEAAGEAGFDDLVALTQVRLPVRAKLEMARNYWDEMGRGHREGMHAGLLDRIVQALDLRPTIETTVWESLALANLMVALAANRRYAWHAVGALGAIEMTAPGRVACVNAGLRRLGVPAAARSYFQLHAGLDVRHSEAWNREVIRPLVEADPGLAQPIAEGAWMRLRCGQRCFRRYRQHFGLPRERALSPKAEAPQDQLEDSPA
ncbi:MAG TPA: iron-containing redox enzyme family protein [Solimonas sp.]|nr:iron-containing redox enzyme family protein [Solimonas sp.]